MHSTLVNLAPNLAPNLETLSGLMRVDAWLAVEVYLDLSALISAGVFILVWIALKFLIFDPYIQIIEDRELQIEGARDDAASMEVRADESLREYQKRIDGARVEASQLRAELRQSGENESNTMLDKARQKARSFVEGRREQLNREMAEAEKDVDAEANSLSKAIVDRVLTSNG